MVADSPFTDAEIAELDDTNELLVHVPAAVSMQHLCDRYGIRANIDFTNETLINNVMVDEDQWFITSASQRPELLYESAQTSWGIYQGEGLVGMDMRRYIAFAGTFKERFGELPDQRYWTFLLSGNYDGSGVSIAGFDRDGVLSHHGWMRNFKAKFAGSRYVALPPRIEVTEQTGHLCRAYRGRREIAGLEAAMD